MAIDTLAVDFSLVDDQALVHHLMVDVNAGGIQTRWSALLTISEAPRLRRLEGLGV